MFLVVTFRPTRHVAHMKSLFGFPGKLSWGVYGHGHVKGTRGHSCLLPNPLPFFFFSTTKVCKPQVHLACASRPLDLTRGDTPGKLGCGLCPKVTLNLSVACLGHSCLVLSTMNFILEALFFPGLPVTSITGMVTLFASLFFFPWFLLFFFSTK